MRAAILLAIIAFCGCRHLQGGGGGWAPVLPPAPVISQQRTETDVCARYQNSGQTYHMAAVVDSGAALNAVSNTFRFNAFSQYVVIFWAPGQATIIELQFGGLTAFWSDGTDQEGRMWSVARYSPFNC